MHPNELLQQIFKTRKVQDAAGNSYPLDGNIDEREGAFLQQLIREYKPTSTIEVGCAFGISSLYICSELMKTAGAHHTIVDGFQTHGFKGVGIANLKRAGVDFFELVEGLSEIELPRLLSEGKKYDFCFIDGDHTFDHTLLDFFYMDKMVNVGGLVVFDDVGFPAVTKAVRYVMNYPNYKFVGNVADHTGSKRKLFESVVKQPLHLLSNLFPQKLKHELFSASVIASDKKLGLNTSMVALQKVKEDERLWSWYKEF